MKRIVIDLIFLILFLFTVSPSNVNAIPMDASRGFEDPNATFWPIEYSAIVDRAVKTATFQMTFNKIPDLYSADSFGRQANSFQWYIDTDAVMTGWMDRPGQNGWEWNEKETETIIAGRYIHNTNKVHVFDNDWPNRLLSGTVPYSLDSSILSFTTPLDLINETDDVFTYHLLITEYGGGDAFLYGRSDVIYKGWPPSNIPEPTTILLLGVGLFGIAGFIKKPKR